MAIGASAGGTTQSTKAVAIGLNAGFTTQGEGAVAIGDDAGYTTQGAQAVAIGPDAGKTSQGATSVAIGLQAGRIDQDTDAVAIGLFAGRLNQGSQSIAIGKEAGRDDQGVNGIALGYQAGITSQANEAIAIGYQAGYTGQGAHAIAIGQEAGKTSQAAQSIVLNATGSILNNTQEDSFVVKPIASAVGTTMLMYDATSGQVTHTATPLITGDLAVSETYTATPTIKYFEVETGAGTSRMMRSGINMSTFGQSVAPVIDLTSYRASPADGDAGPKLVFRASTDGSSNSVIATFETKVIATAWGAKTTEVSITTDNAGTSVTPFKITGNTVYSASHISIADLKTLVAASADFADYQTRIAAL